MAMNKPADISTSPKWPLAVAALLALAWPWCPPWSPIPSRCRCCCWRSCSARWARAGTWSAASWADLLRPCRVRGRGRLYHLAAAASPEAHAVAGHPAGRADQRRPGLAGGRADAAPVGPLLRHGHHRAAPDRPAADDQLGLGGRRRGAGGPDRRRGLDAVVPQQGAVLLDRRGPGVPDVLRHVLPGAFEDRLLLARHQRRRGPPRAAWAWPPTATRCWPSCCRPA